MAVLSSRLLYSWPRPLWPLAAPCLFLLGLCLLTAPSCQRGPAAVTEVSLNQGSFKLTLHGRLSPLDGPNPDTQPTLVSMAVKGAEHWQGWKVDGPVDPLIAEIELAMKEGGYTRMQPPGTPRLVDAGLPGDELALSLAYGRRSDSSGFIIPFWDFRKADFDELEKKKGKDFAEYFQRNPVGFMIIPIVP